MLTLVVAVFTIVAHSKGIDVTNVGFILLLSLSLDYFLIKQFIR